jgi:isopropylmalate/homocitrate/citramalate synthase
MTFVNQSSDRFISPHNFAPELRAQLHLPNRVIINDLTLREGRQVEGVYLAPEDLQRIALKLQEIGVPMLQLHHTPEQVKAIAELKLTTRVEVLTSSPTQTPPFTIEAQKKRIDFVLSQGFDLDLCFGTSDQLLLARQAIRGGNDTVESLRERELQAALECVAYTKTQGGIAGTNLQDFLRADFDFLTRFCRELSQVGVDLMTFDDFAGPATPSVYRHVFQKLKRVVSNVPLGIHVTNDFGLGTAVVLGSLEGGAEVLDVGVNSYGERGGHADLAEVAVAVAVFYGMDTGVQLQRLTEVSQFVADIFGLPLPSTKALVGSNAFADVTDVHYLYEGFPWVYRAIAADLVGNRRRAAIAGVSGPLVLQIKAQELGMNLSSTESELLLPRIMSALKARRGGIPDEELRRLIEER